MDVERHHNALLRDVVEERLVFGDARRFIHLTTAHIQQIGDHWIIDTHVVPPAGIRRTGDLRWIEQGSEVIIITIRGVRDQRDVIRPRGQQPTMVVGAE